MNPDQLKQWMRTHERTVRGLAGELAVQPSTVQRWRNGSRPIPVYLHLALAGITGNQVTASTH